MIATEMIANVYEIGESRRREREAKAEGKDVDKD
jgi:hypothetical protein